MEGGITNARRILFGIGYMSSFPSTLAYQSSVATSCTFKGYDEHELMMLELARK